MNAWTRRALVGVVLLALVGLMVAALAYRALWTGYDSAQTKLESRSERLDGVVNAGPDIEALLASARNVVAPWLHPAGSNAQNDIQQQLRSLIMASGATLVSSQAVPEPAVDGKLASIRLTATVMGDWAKLVQFMENLQTQRPPFWVRNASLLREGSSVGNGPQSARLTLQLEAPLAPEKVQQ